ncbi:hypothetical protein [Bradyrhizobium sp. ORS 111]|uniref:hypothetical protein n=1 Tax=Bradyrhizobium sp. ORS 111 TaxID=1685958 RepID=UPI00389070CB
MKPGEGFYPRAHPWGEQRATEAETKAAQLDAEIAKLWLQIIESAADRGRCSTCRCDR